MTNWGSTIHYVMVNFSKDELVHNLGIGQRQALWGAKCIVGIESVREQMQRHQQDPTGSPWVVLAVPLEGVGLDLVARLTNANIAIARAMGEWATAKTEESLGPQLVGLNGLPVRRPGHPPPAAPPTPEDATAPEEAS